MMLKPQTIENCVLSRLKKVGLTGLDLRLDFYGSEQIDLENYITCNRWTYIIHFRGGLVATSRIGA